MADFAPMCNAARGMQPGEAWSEHVWNPAEVAAVIAVGLRAADAALAEEQAVAGLDAMDERAIQGVLASALTAGGWGVHREVPFPGDEAQGDNARDRCDLVLTPEPGDAPLDPIHARRRIDAAEGTLFAPLAERIEHDASRGGTAPAEAMWLEIKTVAQHCYRQGVPSPNRSYGAELVSGPAADIAKLEGDGVIRHAASVVVLFAETERVARHDLIELSSRLLERDLPISTPILEVVPILDRAGNAVSVVAVFPLRGIGLDAS